MIATESPLMMDAHTLGLLEFDKVRELLAGFTASSLGRELARQIEPFTNLDAVRREQDLVSEMVLSLIANQAPPFGGLHDVRLMVRRAAIGTMLSADQLLEVSETLNCTGAIYRYRMRLDQRLTGLIDMLNGIEDLGVTAKTIAGCLDGRGHVLDMASRELAAVRKKLYDLEDRVKNEVKRLLRDPELRKILSYPNATLNGEHYVLPVSANHRHKIPGVVHRVSPTGETVFIEPASIAGLSAERMTLKAEEDREVKRILRRLSQEVGRVSRPFIFALDLIAKLDLVTAKAKFSRDFGMTAPDINTEGRLWLRNARHPLLTNLFRADATESRRQVVPIDLRLGLGFNMLIITGPNTGGKTVTLKTTGLLSLMALSGMHIPAEEGSLVPLFSQIFADIGDEQSLEQSLSTFSSHISRIASIFEKADDKSLVLLDELGSGTDPTEGAALGRAILDELDIVRCRAIVTTHLGDLKTYAFKNDRAENGAVEFDIETLRPTYRLHIGQFGMSNALKIARRLKLPKELLKRAHKYLKKRGGKSSELLRLQEMREEAEKAREVALSAQHEANQQREEYERKTAEITQNASEKLALETMRLNLQPNDRVHVERFNDIGRVMRVNAVKQTITVRVGIGQWEVPFDEIFPKPEE
jgi:DNA mismatch repair protein MutS2